MKLNTIRKCKCPICRKNYVSKDAVYDHIERAHKDMIPEGIPSDQYFYDLTHDKTTVCVICKRKTPWNPKTHKYARLCGRKECAQKNREIFKERMMRVYNKYNLANDPEHQKKMLAARKISGRYEWENGGEPTTYVGSYEKDFLLNCDTVFNFESTDIIAPSPNVYRYTYNGAEHFYIPDFYIPDLRLEVEVKDGGDNPNMHHKIQAVDKVKEKHKDEALMKQRDNNYIKVVNKKYGDFLALINKLRSDDLSPEERRNKIKIKPE